VKKYDSNVILFILLIVMSLLLYLIQILFFRNPRDTIFYFLQDVAFLPLQVAIVTIILGKILTIREKREKIKRINMIISPFFNEIGIDLLYFLLRFYCMPEDLKSSMKITSTWTKSDFQRVIKLIHHYHFQISCKEIDLQVLKRILSDKRDFLLKILENPNLLEHETFTDMLWSIFHLADELQARESIIDLPDSDLNHLTVDLKRVFKTLLVQWIYHLLHLKQEYPYLYSLEIRRNPFEEDRSVIVRE